MLKPAKTDPNEAKELKKMQEGSYKAGPDQERRQKVEQRAKASQG